jgi:hypothetical protein
MLDALTDRIARQIRAARVDQDGALQRASTVDS